MSNIAYKLNEGRNLNKIADDVCLYLDLIPTNVYPRTNNLEANTDARAIICYIAYNIANYNQTLIADMLGIERTTVIAAIKRADSTTQIKEKLIGCINFFNAQPSYVLEAFNMNTFKNATIC